MTLILSIFYDRREEYSGEKRFWYIFTCLFLILIAGLRNGVGGDTQAYMVYFEDAPLNPSDYLSYIEYMQLRGGYMPGWTLMNLLCKRWFGSFYYVQFIQATVVNICLFYFFRQYTTRIFLCALLYGISGQFFNFNTEVMREGMAIGLCCVGMHQYLQGNKKWLYILAGFSLFFHASAIIAFVFPLVKPIQFSYKTLIAAFILSIGLWFISDKVISIVTERIVENVGIARKVLTYADRKTTIFGFLILAIQYLIVQGGISYFAQEGKQGDESWLQRYYHFISFYLVLAIIGCGISGYTRFLNYTIPFYMILLAEYIGNYTHYLRYLAITKTLLLAGFIWSMYFFYSYYLPNNERYHYDYFVPYTSIFDGDVDNSYRYDMYVESVTPQTQDSKNSRDF